MIAGPNADPGFLALTEKISRDRGFGCASYKEKCLRRRIAVRMRATGTHTYDEYARVLDRDSREYDRLLDALTINVTKLFRNWETYSAIRRIVIPALWTRSDPELAVWSAGCSSGEEPYSLAVLFHDYIVSIGETHRLDRVRIVGTDIDRESLAAAERARFAPSAFADTPDDLRSRYFSADALSSPDPAVRAMVRFERRDLLADAPPTGPLHLIVCRNVIIYFDRDSQERLFEGFHAALAPQGVLVLGKVETILGRARSLFTPLRGRERIFQRA